jgi:hypothetical protein
LSFLWRRLDTLKGFALFDRESSLIDLILFSLRTFGASNAALSLRKGIGSWGP